jgi:regulator of sigma E protease
MGKTSPGDSISIGVLSNDVARTFTVTLGEKEGHGYLGVGPGVEKVRYSVARAAGQAFMYTGMVFGAIVNFFNPSTFSESAQSSRGIVGISVMAADAAKAGALDYAWLIALLSLSLGVMNIMPIPPLDGGKIALEIIERIAGRPFGRRFSLSLSAAGAILLFSLIGYLMYADVARLVQ